MSPSPNLICPGNFVHLSPLDPDGDEFLPCDYCPDYHRATFLVNRIDINCHFNVTRCCGQCAQGWRAIADPLNLHVV